jgi:hypothetical protein
MANQLISLCEAIRSEAYIVSYLWGQAAGRREQRSRSALAAIRAQGHAAANYERARDQAFPDEILADEAFAIQAERQPARIDNPKRKRRFWR